MRVRRGTGNGLEESHQQRRLKMDGFDILTSYHILELPKLMITVVDACVQSLMFYVITHDIRADLLICALFLFSVFSVFDLMNYTSTRRII